MEMLNMAVDLTSFDVLDFAGGILLTGAVAGGRIFLNRRKALTFGNQISTLAQDYKNAYAEADPIISDLEARVAAAVLDFTLSFPEEPSSKFSVEKEIAQWQEKLKTVLKNANRIDNTHLTKEQLKDLRNDLTVFTMNIDTDKKRISGNIADLEQRITKNKNIRRNLLERGDKVLADMKTFEQVYVNAQNHFDRILFAEIPPLLAKAQDFCRAIENKVPRFAYNDYQMNSSSMYKNAEDAVVKLGVALAKIVRYEDFVGSETSRWRNVMKRFPARNEYEKELAKAAMLALMDAETHRYDSGNPPETFANIMRPLAVYIRLRKNATKPLVRGNNEAA